jgi:hypothetical protein
LLVSFTWPETPAKDTLIVPICCAMVWAVCNVSFGNRNLGNFIKRPYRSIPYLERLMMLKFQRRAAI